MKCIVHIIEKVYFTEGQTTLTAPNSHLKHCWVNVWLSLTGLLEEHHLAGLARLRPCALPPQRIMVPSGGMLNQHVDFSLTCIWSHRLYRRYCLTSQFFPESEPKLRNVFSFFLCFFFFLISKPLATVLSIAARWLMELLRISDTACMACQTMSSV